MTNIVCRYGDSYSVVSEGHAGTAQSCTAVSAVVQSLAGWVHNHTGSSSLQKGKAVIVFPEQDGARAVMDMTVIGLLQIQQAAPEDVAVIVQTRVPGSP